MNNNFLIVLLIVVYVFIIFKKKQTIEGLIFNHPDFLKVYPKYNFTINHNQKELIHNNKDKIKYKDLNTKESIEIMNNKNTTNTKLKKQGIPVPNSVKYTKNTNVPNLIIEVEKKLKYPLVVKPVAGSQGKDVNLDINNKTQLIDTINNLSKYKELIIEEQHEGENFRILIVNNKIIDIILRPLPFVIGDGHKKLTILISERNRKQIENGNKPTYNINEQFIQTQKYNINDVIPYNQKVFITNIANYHNGSNPEIIPIDKVHPDNVNMFLRVNQIIGANISGVDWISKDISKSYKEDGIVLEVNGAPAYKMHKILHPKLKISHDIISQLDKYYDTVF